MPNPSDEVVTYLDQIIGATRNGQMEWGEANPTTFLWQTAQPTPGRMIIQRVDKTETQVSPLRVVTITTYVFQAIDLKSGAARFTLKGAENEAINKKLGELYNSAKESNARKSLDFLKSILPPIRP
jgi:hypothetical protein